MTAPRSVAFSRVCALLLCLGLPLLSFGQARLVEKVDAVPGQLVIPYSKYVLPNGLTLIVHEDHSDPLVHVDVTYHVGSAREEIGKSGFAHFFEHMMFEGSVHAPYGSLQRLVREAGGTYNGTTNRDRTNYFETVPSNQLEKMLWLEADRMGFLLDAVTQRKFEIQRSTVKNERGQNYDNVPYGLVREVTSRNLYPYGHPYSWMTIGYVEDLDRGDLNDLKNFFLRWYGPNNAIVTVGGDVEVAQVVALVEKYFGPIPRGPDVVPTRLPLPKLERDRHVTLADNYAQQPMLSVTLPTVPYFHPDEAALDCLAMILGGGRNSILYQDLVKTQKALSATASNSSYELSGELTFTIRPATGVTLAESKRLLDAAIASFAARGVTDEDLARFAGMAESSLINGLQRVGIQLRPSQLGKVPQLARYQMFTGNPNQIGADLRRHTRVTRADVERVYAQYVQGKPAVIVSVATRSAPADIVAPQDYTVDPSGYQAPDYGYKGLTYKKAVDTFDRRTIPAAGETPAMKVPRFWRDELDHGVRILGVETNEMPVISLTLALPGGHLALPADGGKAGLASLYAQMMNDDTLVRSAEEMQTELQKLGSSIAISADVDDVNITVSTLSRNLDRTLALLEERLLQPRFTPTAFARLKRQVLQSLRLQRAQPAQVAALVFGRVNYGRDHPLGVSTAGTEKTVAGLTLADIEDYHRRFIGTGGARLVIVGDVTQAQIRSKLGFLAKLPRRTVVVEKPAPAPAVPKTRIFLVDVPKAAQSEFRVGCLLDLTYDPLGEATRAGVMNNPLGSGSTGRMFVNLRQQKGWTYGAYTALTASKYAGQFMFTAGIRADVTADALREVLGELERFAAHGVTEAEVALTKSALAQRDALLYETPVQKAAFLRQILDYNLPDDFRDRQAKMIAAMDKRQFDELAAKYIQTKALNIVIVGDKAKVLPGLQALGHDIIELDVNGDPLPRAAD